MCERFRTVLILALLPVEPRPELGEHTPELAADRGLGELAARQRGQHGVAVLAAVGLALDLAVRDGRRPRDRPRPLGRRNRGSAPADDRGWLCRTPDVGPCVDELALSGA